MLDELRNLKYPGRKEDIIFFLRTIIGKKEILLKDLRVLCSHVSGGYQLPVESLIAYCTYFDWIKCGEHIHLCEELYPFLESTTRFNRELVEHTVCKLFENKVFKVDLFSYDINGCRFLFRNELLPLAYSSVRNVLISQGFFDTERCIQNNALFVSPDFENFITDFCKKSAKQLTLEQLKMQLERNTIAGDKAEKFVLEYEKRRISKLSLTNRIRIISEIDVRAGYDIVSFESDNSVEYDRFIEVKAISKQTDFYWTINELEIAQLKGVQYCLYLVDLSKISHENYTPTIIIDPANTIIHSSDWLVEPQSFHIRCI